MINLIILPFKLIGIIIFAIFKVIALPFDIFLKIAGNSGNTASKSSEFNTITSNNQKKIEKTQDEKPTNNRQDSAFYAVRASEKHKQGDFIGAIECFNKAIELDPTGGSELLVLRGLSKYKLKNFLDASKDFTKAIKINPKDAKAHSYLGNTMGMLGDFKKAVKNYTISVELDSTDAFAYYHLGYAKDNLGDFKEAVKDYTKAIKLNSDFDLAYYNRGCAKYDLKDTKGALKDLHKAGELGYSQAYEVIKKIQEK